MPIKRKEKQNNKNLYKFLSLPKQTIEIGTITQFTYPKERITGANGKTRIMYPVDVGELSYWLEKGTSKMSGWQPVEKSFNKAKEKAPKEIKKIIHRTLKYSNDFETMWKSWGLNLSSDMKDMIEKIKTPANSKEWIEFKGSSNPLIHRGYFKKNISALINGSDNIGGGLL